MSVRVVEGNRTVNNQERSEGKSALTFRCTREDVVHPDGERLALAVGCGLHGGAFVGGDADAEDFSSRVVDGGSAASFRFVHAADNIRPRKDLTEVGFVGHNNDMSTYEAPTTIREAVDDFRTAYASVRKIQKNDGRTAATAKAIAAHQKVAGRAMQSLITDGQRWLTGQLTEEQNLIARLAGDMTPNHREWLTGRLQMVRSDIRFFARVNGFKDLVAA
jgi:hypothetical protein